MLLSSRLAPDAAVKVVTVAEPSGAQVRSVRSEYRGGKLGRLAQQAGPAVVGYDDGRPPQEGRWETEADDLGGVPVSAALDDDLERPGAAAVEADRSDTLLGVGRSRGCECYAASARA